MRSRGRDGWSEESGRVGDERECLKIWSVVVKSKGAFVRMS